MGNGNIGPVGPSTRIINGSTLPSTCSVGQVFVVPTGGSAGMYVCFTADTWTLLDSNISGEVTGSGTTNVLTKWSNGAGSVIADSLLKDDGTTFSINTNKFTVVESSGNTLIAGTATVSTLTSGRVSYAGTAGLLSDDSGFTYNSSTHALTATTFIGALTGNASTASNLSGTPALPNGTTATTQSQADNGTKLATTAYVDTLGATKQATISFGTGVQTALGVSVGTAGSPVLNGGVLGSPSSAGTLPAFTLGGTIAGGGNQLNNIIIGTSTPLAGTFTTLVGTTINGLTVTNNGTNTLNIAAGKTETFLKTMSFTAADDTGVYTLPTGTKTLLATDGAGTGLTGIPYTITGTANQVVASAGTGNITLSLPQSIATSSTPQFAGIGVGGAFNAATSIYVQGTTTAGGSQYHFITNGVFSSAATGDAAGFLSQPQTAASAFTLPILDHFRAVDATKGAGSTITTQVGFNANNLTAGTNNYGFRGQVSSGANKYNLFMDGTAQNSLAGVTSITNATDSSSSSTGALIVTGGAAINKRVFVPGITASSGLQTAVLCQSSGGEIIADSVACLASSAHTKDQVKPLRNGLDEILALRPISFHYKPEGIFATNKNFQHERPGLIAEEVNKIDPRLVGFEADGVTPRTVGYELIVPVLIRAVQEQQHQIEALNLRLETVNKKLK